MTKVPDSSLGSPERLGYHDIATQLVREIHAGNWPIGAKLPTEENLGRRFGVSRNTVREALRELRDFGYLSKRRGTPSVVIRAMPASFVNSVDSVRQLVEYAGNSDNEVLGTARVVLLPDQARRLDCEEGGEWLRLQILRRRQPDLLPFCYSEIFVAARYSEVAEHLNAESVYAAIERHFNVVIGRVVQDVGAAPADPKVALRLKVPEGAPVLRARTTFYTSDGEIMEIGIANFAAGRYRLRMTLDRREQPAAMPTLT